MGKKDFVGQEVHLIHNVMKLQKELTDLGKSKIQQWRTVIDELEVQLALGKAEAKDMFEQEKKNLSTYIENQKAYFEAEENLKRKQYLELKTQLEDMYQLLQSDLTSGKRDYNKGKKDVLHMIHAIEFGLKKKTAMYQLLSQDEEGRLKDCLDEYRIKLALSTFESIEETLDSKKALQEELSRLMKGIAPKLYPEDNKVNHFMEEISESLEHLKRAFSEILN